jgi:hypothetical protein
MAVGCYFCSGQFGGQLGLDLEERKEGKIKEKR